MLALVFFIVCFASSVVGAICGIGGGVIIKPVLDAIGVLNVDSISFLSGCAVLAMTTYSVLKSKAGGHSKINQHTGIPLGIGGAVGGLLGKSLFSVIMETVNNQNLVGAIQAVCLLLVTAGTLMYTIFKRKIRTFHIENVFFCGIIGIVLGILSSFLGIGGGPINLVVLFFFFSMTTKVAAENSLYIIFYSQIASLISTIVTGKVPDFRPFVLIVMVAGGICGGIAGRGLNKKLREKTVDKLFIGLMVLIICINIYNICKFLP